MVSSDQRHDPTGLLTPKQVAEMLHISVSTLEVWRSTNRYPLPYHKVGKAVRYRLGDVQAFLEANRYQHTSGPTPA